MESSHQEMTYDGRERTQQAAAVDGEAPRLSQSLVK
jgi:hypothetical protein